MIDTSGRTRRFCRIENALYFLGKKKKELRKGRTTSLQQLEIDTSRAVVMIKKIGIAICFLLRLSLSTQQQIENDDDAKLNPREEENNNNHSRRRQVWAWASHKSGRQIGQQLRNDTWANLIDGIQVWCGDCHFEDDGIYLNDTLWTTECRPLFTAAAAANVKIQLMISGAVPESAIQNPQPFIDAARSIYQHHRKMGVVLDGFSIDDERDCAPRANTHDFATWVEFQNVFVTTLAATGIHVTSAVQALFGIENDDDPTKKKNNPCQFKPATYEFDPLVTGLIQTATVQKWLVMDTYYFTTGRFMGNLDWYVQYTPLETLAIGMMNRIDLTEDDLVARFHALHHSNVDWINIFMMPISDQFLPFLQRWKTRCLGCGKQRVLGCYDMSIQCSSSSSNSNNNNEGSYNDDRSTTHSTELIDSIL